MNANRQRTQRRQMTRRENCSRGDTEEKYGPEIKDQMARQMKGKENKKAPRGMLAIPFKESRRAKQVSLKVQGLVGAKKCQAIFFEVLEMAETQENENT